MDGDAVEGNGIGGRAAGKQKLNVAPFSDLLFSAHILPP